MAEPFLGEIRMFGGDFAPRGWAHCHGQLLPIAEHAPLYSLIGTTYGGDGVDTFALPDLRAEPAPPARAALLPITFIIALAGVYPSRP
ncbi:MAG: tail fiber protein [Actinobacteria bacterium]|nr:tail fiber protein [Actinomycetota bacterium]